MNIAKAIKYLQDHGIEVVSNTDTTITVNSVFCKNSKASTEVETISAGTASVRAYLGY